MQPSPRAEVWRPCEPSRRVLTAVVVGVIANSWSVRFAEAFTATDAPKLTQFMPHIDTMGLGLHSLVHARIAKRAERITPLRQCRRSRRCQSRDCARAGDGARGRKRVRKDDTLAVFQSAGGARAGRCAR